MTVFFTADPHFSHRRIIEMTGRPFSDVEEMDAALVQRWNAVVEPGDVVHHLGDVALGDIDTSLALIGQLHGTKHLMAGNHDRCFALGKRNRGRSPAEWLEVYRHAGFATVTDGAEPHEYVMGSGRRVLLSHFPTGPDDAELAANPSRVDRWRQVRPHPRPSAVLLHGHVHTAWQHRWSPWVQGVLEVNVGVDVWDFAPVSEEHLERLIRSVDPEQEQ